jgi:hypothetical protein
VRGDDQPSRYPPRGVWFGLILAAGFAGVLLGQDAPDPSGASTPTDPVVFSAQQVWRWVGADGYYLYMYGKSAALQGVDGIRSREAIARIVQLAAGDDPLYQVEVYAEGEVRDSRHGGPPLPRARTAFRASKVEMAAYLSKGLTELAEPPPTFAILQRSGFVRTTKTGTKRPAPAVQPPPQLGTVYASPRAQSSSQQGRAHPAEDSPIPSPPGPSQSAGPVVEPSPTGFTQTNPTDQASAPGLNGPKVDPLVVRAQMVRNRDPSSDPAGEDPASGQPPAEPEPDSQPPPGGTAKPPAIDLPPIEPAPEGVPGLGVPNLESQAPGVEALPVPDETAPPSGTPAQGPVTDLLPITPGTQRITTFDRRGSRSLDFKMIGKLPDGTEVWICRGGVNIITRADKLGIIDIEADEAVIWRGPSPEKGEPIQGPNGEWIDDANKQPMEVYLEGNVIIRQDQRKWAGKGDQRTLRAPRVYYNFLTDRFLAHDAEIDFWAPGLIQPFKLKAPRIEQFHPLIKQPDGSLKTDENPQIRADHAVSTGSRFPNPGYKITNKSIDLIRSTRPSVDPISGKQLANPGDPDPPQDFIWTMDSRQNLYYMGPFPAFYWPRVVTEIDDQQPAFRQFFFRTNNYFGQQILTDWNGFKFIGVKKPTWIDLWNIDFDYLSARTKEFPAVGSEIGWFGTDFFRDLSDPYHRNPAAPSTITQQYMGYFDIWGLKDFGTDVLGTGYAIVTNGPPGSGKSGILRSSTPPFQQDRGRFDLRHNQRFLPDDEDHQYEELRLQLEAAYYTDRYFLEEYYKRLHDTGMDQETLAYGIYQKDNQAIDVWTEANPMNWQTETQWLPRVDYYRLGDSLLSDWFTYYQHSGGDYAVTNTDIMVNNPNLFAFMPYDPVSNTSGIFSTGRFYTNHELDMPLKFFNAFRLVPYVQGSLVGWTDQLGGGPLGHSPSGPMGRAWGGVGLRGEMTLYKKYPHVMNEIMNIHGLNHKISLFFDARAAYSNVRLNNIAVQDDLDDNTYEAVRRYLAITTFAGGILPMPYDPRHLLLRQMVSPITGTTDVQGSMDAVMLGLHQRLQTKRGPIGRRRIVDYMTLDATSTYFPNSARDNFGTPWGQTMYNYQWYLGDRTSIVSQGWFEFWKLVGSNPLPNSIYPYSLDTGYNPNGMNIITTGISLARPPRSNIFVGYTIIDTGPIHTSAMNTSISYWLSPKWYGTFSTSYDFGDATDLGTMFTFTRIGADYLTTIGLSVDPQRMSYQFAVQITPRISPAFRMGSNAALNSFDTRFAPTE